MTLKQKRNLRLTFCFILTVIFVAMAGYLLYRVHRYTKTGIFGYAAIVLFTVLCVFFSSLTFQSKLIFIIAVVFLPYFGIAMCLYLWLGKTDACSEDSKKVRLWVDKQPILKNSKGEITYFSESPDLWTDILNTVSNAKKEVLIFTYIFKLGENSSKLISVLYDLLKKGVTVKLATDYYGSGDILKEEQIKALKKAGADITVKNKPLFLLLPSDNRRTHAKVFIIDRKILYTGSLNVDDDGIKKDKNCGVKINGVDGFFSVFCSLWNMKGSESAFESQTLKPYLAPNKANVEELFISMISNARKSIKIMTPYLSFGGDTKRAIIRAINRGVKITVIIPSENPPSRLDKITKHFAQKLSDMGAFVYHYDGGFLHSKILLSDDSMSLTGSCNFDIRSGRYAVESILLSADNGLIAPLLKDLDKTLSFSTKLIPDKKKKSIIIDRLIGLFAPLI